MSPDHHSVCGYTWLNFLLWHSCFSNDVYILNWYHISGWILNHASRFYWSIDEWSWSVIMSPLCWVVRAAKTSFPQTDYILNTSWCQSLSSPELHHFSSVSSVIVLHNSDSSKNKHRSVIIHLHFSSSPFHRMQTPLRCEWHLLFHTGFFPYLGRLWVV